MDYWQNRLDQRLGEQEKQAGKCADDLLAAYNARAFRCYSNINPDRYERSTGPILRLRASSHSLHSRPHGIERPTSFYRPPSLFKGRFEELRNEGVPVSDHFDRFWAYDWSSLTTPYDQRWGHSQQGATRAEENDFNRMLERMNRQKCREGNFPADMKTINNKLTAYADKLQITAIADYSFRLAAITTLNVIEETAAAMVEPADSQPF